MGNNDRVGGMTVQGKGKIGKNQRKIGDTGRNPDMWQSDRKRTTGVSGSSSEGRVQGREPRGQKEGQGDGLRRRRGVRCVGWGLWWWV